MRIVLGIHALDMYEGKVQNFLEYQFKQDPKTYFLFFPSYKEQKNHLGRLAEKFSEHKDKFILVEQNWTTPSKFSSYEKSFSETIKALVKKCGAKERVNIISFGGLRDICYRAINPEAKKAVREAFKGREIREYHYRPLIYPKPEKPIPGVRIPANRRRGGLANRRKRK